MNVNVPLQNIAWRLPLPSQACLLPPVPSGATFSHISAVHAYWPHDVKEKAIHQTKPPSFIAPVLILRCTLYVLSVVDSPVTQPHTPSSEALCFNTFLSDWASTVLAICVTLALLWDQTTLTSFCHPYASVSLWLSIFPASNTSTMCCIPVLSFFPEESLPINNEFRVPCK